MNKNKITLLSAGIALVMASSAQAYQWELGVGYADGEVESVDTEAYSVDGTLYLKQVDTRRGPLAEAAFLDRVSALYIGGSKGEIENVDTDSASIGLHWVEYSGLIVDLSYGGSSVEEGEVELEADVTSIGLGVYIASNATLGVSYSDIDLELSDDVLSAEAEGESWSVDYKIVVPGDISYGIDVSYVHTDFDGIDKMSGFSVGGTIYPTNDLGIGLTYSSDVLDTEGPLQLALDDISSDIYTLHASWFVTEAISIGVEYTDGELEDIDMEEISVGANFRF